MECWRGVIELLESNLNGPRALEKDCGRLLSSNKINKSKLKSPFFRLASATEVYGARLRIVLLRQPHK